MVSFYDLQRISRVAIDDLQYEMEASYYGKRHFTQKYGDLVWSENIEERYPTKK